MIPLNLQPVEKAVYAQNPGQVLDVVDVWSTIQGEGPYAGRPAVFIRLAGCVLQCPRCDTDYTSARCLMSVRELAGKAYDLSGRWGRPLAVITGGEPLRQNLEPLLIQLAHRQGFLVQVETNGLLYQRDLEPFVFDGDLSFVLSPKTPKIHSRWEDEGVKPEAYKYVLDADAVDPEDGLPLSALGMPGRPARPRACSVSNIFVQPLDVGDAGANERHRTAALASCMQFGYRLSLQLHKIVGMP